jgi:uncharacterized membrane protein
MPTTDLTPAVTIHLVFALGALLLGPFALLLRKGTRWHRGAGYGWVTLMVGTALSSLFVRSFALPNVAGYSLIHLITLAALGGLGLGVWHIVQGRVERHRRAMRLTYLSLLVAGAFAMAPHRTLGALFWQQALGLA